jgi:hypothetical protein
VIPSLALLRIEGRRWRSPRLLVPLFLLWIPLLLLGPLIVLAMVGLSLAGGIDPWRACGGLWAILCGLPGTEIDVGADGHTVRLSIL